MTTLRGLAGNHVFNGTRRYATAKKKLKKSGVVLC